jgi:phosphate-selective porin OprO/OprP
MRIVSLFLVGILLFALTDRSVLGQEPLYPGRDLLAQSEPESSVFDERNGSIGQLAGVDALPDAADSADAAGPLVPDGVPNSGLPPLDPRFNDLEARFNKLSKKFDAAQIPKKTTYPTVRVSGFTQLDSAWYSQTPKNIATVGDAQDGTGFRRARLAVLGKAAEFTNYQLEVDFANAGRPSFFDTYVEQENLPYLGSVRVGHFLQPFSVGALSGFRNLPFLERSLPFLAFVPFRRDGVMAHNVSEDERTGWAYSVFRTGGFNNAPLGDSRFGTDFGDIGGYSFSTRVTHLAWMDDDGRCFLQIGGSYDYSQLGANDAAGSGTSGNAGSPRPFYQARTGPEFGPLGLPENSTSFGNAANGTPYFVDTGRYEASNFNLFGVETVYQNGPFSFQGEWMGTVVDSVAGPVFYNGAYAEVMYRLTGEHREYEKKFGALKNPIPFRDFISIGRGPDRGIKGWGAWEVAYRWSFVDLNNPSKLDGHYYNSATNTFTGNNHSGNGSVNDSTLGVSWFLNANTKIQANWICALLNNEAKGFSTANLFVTRVQVAF